MKFSRPKLKRGEKYVGAVIDSADKGHHTILLPGDWQGTHDEMMAKAKKEGGDLPDRVEQALLFRDHRDAFKRAWYWSNMQHAEYADYAWFQGFGNGAQDHFGKSGRGRARAVRRVPIGEQT